LEKLNKLESECDHKWELESGLERASGEISEMRVELPRKKKCGKRKAN